MSSSSTLDATTAILLLLAGVVLLPLLVMGLGFGGVMGYGMMGSYGGPGGWWPLAGLLAQLILLAVLLGGGYLLVRIAGARVVGRDPAVEELRLAYARGELTDEEYEERRSKLDRSS